MKRAVDLLKDEHRFVSALASVALLGLVVALLVIGAFSVALNGAQPASDHVLNKVIAVLLGVVLIFSMAAMFLGSFFVVRARKNLCDWGSFIAITWLIPYIGISVYLGGSNLLKAWKNAKPA